MNFYEERVQALTSLQNKKNVVDFDVAAKKTELDSLKESQDKLQEQIDLVLAEITSHMKSDGVKHVDKDIFEIKIPKGREVIVIESEDELPDEFFETKKVASKKLIKVKLDAGETVKGAKKVVNDAVAKVTFKEPD